MQPDGRDVSSRLETFRARLRHSLGARFLLRYHVTLIIGASIGAGWLVDVTLLKAGLRNMFARYPAAILVSYGAFLLGVGAWLRFSGIGEYLEARRAEELVGDDVPTAFASSPPEGLGWLAQGVPPYEGCAWVMVIAFVVLALGGYTVITAPSLFADVVLEVLLAAGLVRGVHQAYASGWVSSVVAHTWGSLAIALLLAFFAGLFAQGLQPHPATLHELWVRLRVH